MVLIDDVGVDRMPVYAEAPHPGVTPSIDALAAQGVVFRNAWAAPLCSVARANLLTGLLAGRTGIGNNVEKASGHGLESEDLALPEALRLSGVRSKMVGKWHLNQNDWHDYPRTLGGFESYNGVLFNVGSQGGNYYDWLQTEDGVQFSESGYLTSRQIDDTIDYVSATPSPWFLLLSTTSAHGPQHVPPPHLFTQPPPLTMADRHRVNIEALDTELGRLFAALPANTYVILLADNGTPSSVTELPFLEEHAKGTMYEGGLNVPMIVWGPQVLPGESEALVSITDVFSTVLDLFGSPYAKPSDSVSMTPYLTDPGRPSIRSHVTAEFFLGKTHRWAIRDGRGFKLIRRDEKNAPRKDELYDLSLDPWELNDLLRAPLAATSADHYAYLARILDGL